MSDNTTLDPGTGGDTIATDDVAGIKYQRVKLTDGTADSATVIAAGGGVESGALRVTVASDSTGVLSVDDNGGSLTVDAASLPLPTGASTAAKQPALGTAGAASADVLSVQGVASMTALKVDGSGVTQPVSGTVTANLGTAAVTNAGTFAVQIAANSSVNQAQVAGTATDTNSGVKSAGTQRVVLATDQPQLTNALKVDGSAVTQPVSGTVTANAGTGPFPVSDNAGSLTVDAPVGTPVFTTPTPSATGGWSKQMYAAQTTTVRTVKGTAGTWGGYGTIYNPNASVAYVQVFDVATATTVTLGTTVPDMIIPIPAGSAANMEVVNGVNMALGIKLACTTTATGSTAPATGLDMTVFFK